MSKIQDCYKWKTCGKTDSVMPREKRKGIVPAHGYCSGKPAEKIGEAMQLGNGRMSASVYGKPYEERIVYGHERLYLPLLGQVPPPPPLAEAMPQIRSLLLEGKGVQAAELASDLAREKGGHGGLLKKPEKPGDWEIPVEGFVRHSGAELKFSMERGNGIRDYLRCVDFMQGETAVYWTDDRGFWCRKGFVSRDNTLHMQSLSIPEGRSIQIRLRLEPFQEEGEHEWERMSLPEEVRRSTGTTGNLLWFQGWYEKEISREGYVVALKAEGDQSVVCAGKEELCVQASGELVCVCCIRHFEEYQPSCLEAVLEELESCDMNYNSALTENQNSHGRLMRESVLETEGENGRELTIEELLARQHLRQGVDHLLLEKYYDAGRYFQTISTGELPPLIGQWNINVNLQVCGANLTGLQELMLPYFAFIEKNLPDFRENARRIYGCRGIVADIHPDMHNGLLYHFSKTWPHQFYTAGAGWMYHEFFYYYLTTGDKEFLREHVEPGLREIGEFYDDFLKDKDEDGRFLFYPCLSPENSPAGSGPATVNAVMDIMVCREVLENLLKAQDILGIEDSNRARWEEILTHLPKLLLDEEGGLKEWAWEGHRENYDHRCVSHHYDVWPGDKINPEDEPELAEAVWISNRKRPLENDSCHGIMHRLFTAVRLRDTGYAKRLLHMLFEYGYINSNMTTNHYPYRVVFPDMLGSMPAVVGELLVCSRPGWILFLPAAEGLLPAGSVTGLRLYTLVRLDRMQWDLEKGKLHAQMTFLDDVEVKIGFGTGIETCWINGCVRGLQNGQTIQKGKANETILLDAHLGKK